MATTSQDSQEPYVGTSSYANDYGVELMQVIISWYRGHRNVLSSTEATNIGTAVTSLLNGTYHI